MALLSGSAPADTAAEFVPIPVREHLRAIAWLRWRLFVNALRKGGELSLFVKIISFPFIALVPLGVLCGSAAAAWYSVSEDRFWMLTATLWGIAVFSQFFPIFTAAAAPPFDFASLIRFPFRYRGYLALRIFYGLLDSHAVMANFAVFGVFCGLLIADAPLALRALPVLLLFAAVNFFFTRMVLAWIDRWLARRKTREILGVFVVLFSLGFQLAAQAPRYIRHARLSAADHPTLLRAWDLLHMAGAVLPPSIAGRGITQIAHGSVISSLIGDLWLLLFAATFAMLLHLRLFAEYRGENLNEAPKPAAPKPRQASASAPVSAPAATLVVSSAASADGSRFGLDRVTRAMVDKEVRLLLRGSAKIQQLASPLMIAVIFIFRSHSTGRGSDHLTWPMIAVYAVFFMSTMLNNSMGTEGAGVNFYFLAPVRMREVMLGKNIVTLGIYLIEMVIIYGIVAFFSTPPPAHNMIFTLEWSAFALAVCFTVGNLLSLYSPRKYEPGKTRRQTTSGIAGFISFGIMIALATIGFVVHFLAGYLAIPYLPEMVFTVLTAIAVAAYVMTLNRMDTIAFNRREQISAELCKQS